MWLNEPNKERKDYALTPGKRSSLPTFSAFQKRHYSMPEHLDHPIFAISPKFEDICIDPTPPTHHSSPNHTAPPPEPNPDHILISASSNLKSILTLSKLPEFSYKPDAPPYSDLPSLALEQQNPNSLFTGIFYPKKTSLWNKHGKQIFQDGTLYEGFFLNKKFSTYGR
jgi:hypothetical protein